MEESVIFHLDQRNYDRLIEKRNPQALEMLRDIVHTKLTLHFSRLHDDTIPLYRYFLYVLDEKEKDARRNARMPRTKTAQEMEVSIENLQKGPLIDMYGPGSVFYLIRKRAKEMKLRQQKRQTHPSAPFQQGLANKTSQMGLMGAASRGIMTRYALTSNIYSHGNDEDDQSSTTASMINLYGAQNDANIISTLGGTDFMDGM